MTNMILLIDFDGEFCGVAQYFTGKYQYWNYKTLYIFFCASLVLPFDILCKH